MKLTRAAVTALACSGLLFACGDDDTSELFNDAGMAGMGGSSAGTGTAGMSGSAGTSMNGGSGGNGGSGDAGTAGTTSTAGTAGMAGSGGSTGGDPDGGAPDDPDASTDAGNVGEVDAAPLCGDAGDCNDDNECTLDICGTDGVCSNPPADNGSPCGDGTDNECTNPDTCDGAGACQPNHEAAETTCGDPLDDECTNPDACDGNGVCQPNHEPAATTCGDPLDNECTDADTCDGNGVCANNSLPEFAACTGGVCGFDACQLCADQGSEAANVTLSWSVAGKTDVMPNSCTTPGLPDAVILFKAPATGTYRIDATSTDGADPVLAVIADYCVNDGDDQLDCDNDTVGQDARIDIALTQGDQISIVVNADDGSTGDSGGLTIALLAE